MIVAVKIQKDSEIELIRLSDNISIVSITDDNIGYFVLLPKGKYEYIGNDKPYDTLIDNNPNFRDLAFSKILAEYNYVMENNKIDKETEDIFERTEIELREEYARKSVACFEQI